MDDERRKKKMKIDFKQILIFFSFIDIVLIFSTFVICAFFQRQIVDLVQVFFIPIIPLPIFQIFISKRSLSIKLSFITVQIIQLVCLFIVFTFRLIQAIHNHEWTGFYKHVFYASPIKVHLLNIITIIISIIFLLIFIVKNFRKLPVDLGEKFGIKITNNKKIISKQTILDKNKPGKGNVTKKDYESFFITGLELYNSKNK